MDRKEIPMKRLILALFAASAWAIIIADSVLAKGADKAGQILHTMSCAGDCY
jgi:hypothetical protein